MNDSPAPYPSFEERQKVLACVRWLAVLHWMAISRAARSMEVGADRKHGFAAVVYATSVRCR